MRKGKNRVIDALLPAGLAILLLAGLYGAVSAQEESFLLPELQPSLSTDGSTLYNAVPPLVVVADPNPYAQGIKIQGLTAADALAAPEAAASTFKINYIAAGGTDPWDQVCAAFPAEAKTAFNAAAAIWAIKLKSAVPIKINACWAGLGSPSILGYSGGQPLRKNFSGAPKANTWYQGSLANSIAGSDLDPADYDINITFNSGFTWYYSTDGNPPAGQYDLVTVAAHEIGHGLNFSGTAKSSSGSGSFGVKGLPNVYDTFMESGVGQAITTYATSSAALGTLLTSNDLWFNGPNARAGNGGERVKIYAPSSWSNGSSYSHLDYNTFKGTVNSMMVYAVASGAANHDPGPVTLGLLKDLGWKLAGNTPSVPTPKSPGGTITDTTPTYKWTKVAGATQYRYKLKQGTTVVYTKTVASSACGATTCTDTPATALAASSYKWKVQAKVGGIWSAYSAFRFFTVAPPSSSGPKAGLWTGPDGIKFYVTVDQQYVNYFYVIVNIPGCSTTIHWGPIFTPITNNIFSYNTQQALYLNAEGTFDSDITAHGTASVNGFPSASCGMNVNVGPIDWTATWRNSNQP